MTQVRTHDDLVKEVEYRLAAFKYPSFDRTIVEQLLALKEQWRHDAKVYRTRAEAAEEALDIYRHGPPAESQQLLGALAANDAARKRVAELEAELNRSGDDDYQARVHRWMMSCFSDKIVFSQRERNCRFLEESLELVQALGFNIYDAHEMVDYVFKRPAGKPTQEVGGVLVCLAALCNATDIDMNNAGETELTRIWSKIDQIRAKHAGKPLAVRTDL